MQIQAEKRNIFGKKLKGAREAGKLPAVLYGKGIESTPLFVDLGDFERVWREAGENTIIELLTPEKKFEVLIYDVAFDPVKGKPIHADFFAIERGRAITAEVPLAFVGTAPAVKERGGNLVKVIHEVEVECLPKDLPHELEADISGLVEIGDKLFIKDITLPEGVKILANPEEVVALVELPEEETEEETAPPSMDEIEVEKRGKEKEEEETEGEGK